MLVTTVECKECKVFIYSRADEDVRECHCGRIVVSGGLQHFKFNIAPGSIYEVKKKNVHANAHVLYEDWHSMKDQFGLIKEESKHTKQTCI